MATTGSPPSSLRPAIVTPGGEEHTVQQPTSDSSFTLSSLLAARSDPAIEQTSSTASTSSVTSTPRPSSVTPSGGVPQTTASSPTALQSKLTVSDLLTSRSSMLDMSKDASRAEPGPSGAQTDKRTQSAVTKSARQRQVASPGGQLDQQEDLQSRSLIKQVRSLNVVRRKRVWASLIDMLVLSLLGIIVLALIVHQNNITSAGDIYFESQGKSQTPYFARDSVPVPPTFFFESLRLQKQQGSLNPALMVLRTSTMQSFVFNQSYETLPEVQALNAGTAKADCMAATTGSGWGFCRMPADLALAALNQLPFVPTALVQQIEADVQNSTNGFKYVVFGSYLYTVQAQLSVVKMREGTPDLAVSLSACIDSSSVEIVNGYNQVRTSECMNYGDVKSSNLQFIKCSTASTYPTELVEQICYSLMGEYGRAMTVEGKLLLHTGEVASGSNGIMVPRSGNSTTGLMLLPSEAVVSVEDIGSVTRTYISVRGIGLRGGMMIGLTPSINVFHYGGVAFMAAAVAQMLIVMLVLRWTRRHSPSTIDTLTIYNRLGSSILVFGQIIYSGFLINGVSYALTRLYGVAKMYPVLLMEVCSYILNCLMWHHVIKKGFGKQAVEYRSLVVIASPIILGVAAMLYRTLQTAAKGAVFDDKQVSGSKCRIPGKFCYQTSYHKYYVVGYTLLPIGVNVLLYLDRFLKRLFGFPLRKEVTKNLLPFEIIYGRRRVTSITSDYEYNYIPADSIPPTPPQDRSRIFSNNSRVIAIPRHLAKPNYVVTLEGVELCGFMFVNRSALIRQKDVLIAYVARFVPFAQISIMVWFCDGTQMSQATMLSGEDFRQLCIVEGFFNYGGSPLSGYLKLSIDEMAAIRSLFPRSNLPLIRIPDSRINSVHTPRQAEAAARALKAKEHVG